jgi:hypothetical protein
MSATDMRALSRVPLPLTRATKVLLGEPASNCAKILDTFHQKGGPGQGRQLSVPLSTIAPCARAACRKRYKYRVNCGGSCRFSNGNGSLTVSR